MMMMLSQFSSFSRTLLRNAPRTTRSSISSNNIRSSHFYCSFVGRSFTSTSQLQQPLETGLFSIPELQRPDDFQKITQTAIQQGNNLRTQISSASSSLSNKTTTTTATTATTASTSIEDARVLLHLLDGISQAVCNVIDAAELCRSVHADPNWQQAANQAFMVLSDYIAQLNSDTTLYNALQVVNDIVAKHNNDNNNDNNNNAEGLSQEETRFAALLQAEFERDGIHLQEEQRNQVRKIQNQITQLESTFHSNMIHSSQKFTVKQASTVEEVIPKSVLQTLPLVEYNINDNLILDKNDAQVLQTLLKYSSNPALRKEIFMEFMTSVPENLSVLEELRTLRHDLAVQQGFTSFADRSLRDKMAGSTENVLKFIHTVQTQNQSSYQRDMASLQMAKQAVEGTGEKVQPWDVSFYSGLLKAQLQGGEGDDGSELQAKLSEYFTLTNTLASMQLLVEKLFGITMKEETISNVEKWDVIDRNDPNGSSIRKYSFTDDETGKSLGTMYLDLHPRPGKYGHAAHFTVRCGCVNNIDRYSTTTTTTDGRTRSTDYQLPIVALVCNLSSKQILSHGEVETMFHEFGHALHSLLSRTQFQHVSGTRAAMDFVETPSHLLEHFVWDAQFLSQHLASHYVTGESIPKELVISLQQSRHALEALERQNQILYALLDQNMFGIPQNETSTEIFARLHSELGVPYAPGTHWHSRFGHLISYGATYYGYLYSQIFAQDIWDACFRHNPLDRKAGTQVWHKLLQYGGAKDPAEMLTDLLGRKIKA